jgi:hypothetical protein
LESPGKTRVFECHAKQKSKQFLTPILRKLPPIRHFINMMKHCFQLKIFVWQNLRLVDQQPEFSRLSRHEKSSRRALSVDFQNEGAVSISAIATVPPMV